MVFSQLARTLGFTRLPLGLIAAIVAIIPTYLLVLELGKRVFYRHVAEAPPSALRALPHEHRILRRAARWRVHHGVRGAEGLRASVGRAA
jgi:P-type Mg2+ transporter